MAARLATPREIEAAEDIYLNGFHDEEIGSVDELGHVYITPLNDGGPWVMVETDTDGFRHGIAGTEHDIRWEYWLVTKKYDEFYGADEDDE